MGGVVVEERRHSCFKGAIHGENPTVLLARLAFIPRLREVGREARVEDVGAW